MTDVIALAHRMYRRIRWQQVPETVDRDELVDLIMDAIEYLYVLSGRNRIYSDDMYTETKETEEQEEQTQEPEPTGDTDGSEEAGDSETTEPEEPQTDGDTTEPTEPQTDVDPFWQIPDGVEEPERELYFLDDLTPAEKRIVLLKAQIEFYKMVQADHDDDTSYTTDAMSVTHGDKPFEHIGQTIDRLEGELALMWTRLPEYNQLGVSG